jgi:O-antigen/teichoic acid export membrane protein
MPRLTRLEAEGKNDELIAVYRMATKFVAISVIPIGLMLSCFSSQVLWIWTGDIELVQHANHALSLYTIGYVLLSLGAFPYYLQFAKGNLKLHLIGNLLFVVLLVPLIIWAASIYGIVGAGWAWLCVNAIYFLIWTPLVHRRFKLGLHYFWLTRDILFTATPSVIIALFFYVFIEWSDDRLLGGIQLVVSMMVFVLTAFVQYKFIRKV